MKKLLALLLCATLLLAFASAAAQEEAVDFTPFGFTLTLPEGIELAFSPDDSSEEELIYVGGNDEGTFVLCVSLYRDEGAADIRAWSQDEVDAFAESIAAEEGYQDVGVATIGDTPFVLSTYDSGESLYYEAFTYLNDYQLVFTFFGAMPMEEMSGYAELILSSFAHVD